MFSCKGFNVTSFFMKKLNNDLPVVYDNTHRIIQSTSMDAFKNNSNTSSLSLEEQMRSSLNPKNHVWVFKNNASITSESSKQEVSLNQSSSSNKTSVLNTSRKRDRADMD
jgi:hypothetical protein